MHLKKYNTEMGTWGTSIKDNDAFTDIYNEFFDLYNKGGKPDKITKQIIKDNWEILEIEEEKNNLWFALALAQWETKSLELEVLSTVKEIISSGADLKIWVNLGASEKDIKKRKIVLDKFFEKIKTDRPKAKPRKRAKLKTPIFEKGDCLVFKMTNDNYGGAVVLERDYNPETANNLVVTTRLNQNNKPTLKDFENAEVLICNFANWQEEVNAAWLMPDLFYKAYANIYENIGKITVDIAYDPRNYVGKGYLFHPSWSAAWRMKDIAERQFESERSKPKPTKTITIRQMTKNKKWWKIF